MIRDKKPKKTKPLHRISMVLALFCSSFSPTIKAESMLSANQPANSKYDTAHDVRGIRLGMSLSEVESQIKQIDINFNSEPALLDHRHIGVLYTVKQPLVYLQILVAIDSNKKVWLVGQSQQFVHEGRMEYLIVRQQLIDKCAARITRHFR